MKNPRRLIFLAFVMVLMGAVLPFLMVMGTLESSILLNFIAYGVSVGGLFLGVISAAHYVRESDWNDKH
jgi:hypothetical protein